MLSVSEGRRGRWIKRGRWREMDREVQGEGKGVWEEGRKRERVRESTFACK